MLLNFLEGVQKIIKQIIVIFNVPILFSIFSSVSEWLLDEVDLLGQKVFLKKRIPIVTIGITMAIIRVIGFPTIRFKDAYVSFKNAIFLHKQGLLSNND